LTSVNELLLKVELLNQNDINELREQIHLQFKEATAKQKASILAQKIYEIIDDSLPDFSPETKRTIRMELLNKQLQTKSLTITANDIVSSSIEVAAVEEVGQELSQWILKKAELDETATKDYLEQFLNVEKPLTAMNNSLVNAIQVEKNINFSSLSKWYKKKIYLLGLTLVSSIFLILLIEFPLQKKLEGVKGETLHFTETMEVERMANELPDYLQYDTINEEKLRKWLYGRNSMLADEPYFSTVINVADEFNINPLLLFAITGQEQGFVSKENKRAEEIANNPFNVFHSWEDFNTNILESSQIAARTIVNLSKDRPEDADPIQWINRKYAEDENWWIGVSKIFAQLEKVVK